jgi:hypothetical protein
VGGILRTGAIGAAILGAAAFGLAIGNEIYETGLNRPFGPSLGDLLFPQLQPQPLPAPEHQPQPGFCPVVYQVFSGTFLTNPNNGNREYSETQPGNYHNGPFTGIDGPVRFNGYSAYYHVGPNIGFRTLNAYNISDSWIDPEPHVRFQRADNQPDNCLPLVLEPLPEPMALPQPSPTRPGELPYLPEPLRLPTPSRLRPFLLPPSPDRPREPSILPGAGAEPIFEPLPPLLTFPFPPPNFFPEPETETSSLRVRPPNVQPVATVTNEPGFECCPSLERKLDDLLDREECEPCDLTEIEERLKEIAEKLCVAGSGSVDLTPCDAEEETITQYQGEGIEGMFAALTAITQSLNLIHEDTRCDTGECVSAVPDWWQVRKGAETPQLSVVLRKHGTKNYHALNIPHPITEPRPTSSPIAPYTAGNWQATIYCSDNSKFIVNARTKTEAVRVATEAAALIKPEYLPSPLQIATTERRGFAINTSIMHPRYLDYFAEGQKGRRPNWRVNLE